MSGVYTPPESTVIDDAAKGPSYCDVKWREALEVCSQNLSDYDLAQLNQVDTCDGLLSSLSEIQRKMAQTTGPNLVQRLRPSLDPLRSFVTLLAASLGSSTIQTALIWGVMSLVIHAAGRTETLLPETIEMLNDLGHDLEIFQIYETIFASNTPIGDELMDIFVDIIVFWTQAIHFLRRNKHGESPTHVHVQPKLIESGTTAVKSWPNVQHKFEETSKRIRKRSQQIKEKAKALASTQPRRQADLLTELEGLGLIGGGNTISTSEDKLFPCHNIPFPSNPHFYGRERELRSIREHLDEGPVSGFRSFALFGTGGIGKTQTALTYAYEKANDGVDVVLWLHCETSLSLARSFYEIAAMLQLEGLAEDENSDQNRFLVLKWRRKTSASWFMVMDNVEDIARIRNAWPNASRGAILVTSRNDIVSIDPAAGGMEIEVFSEDDGASFLMTLIGRTDYSFSEKDAARQLSARFGGLALALATMASQIRLRRTSIGDFVIMYEKHSRKLHEERRGIETYYEKSLVSCWQTAFRFLSEDASALLGVIAMIAPDQIPEALFKHQDSSVPPSRMSFCNDEWAFGEALEQLLSTSLVKRDPSTAMLFVHRLIQEEYRDFIGKDEQQAYFCRASTLLQAKYPKLINGLPLRNHWSNCKLYIEHVLILCIRDQDSKFRPKSEGEFDVFLDLSCSCGWYLMECGAWSEELDLMRTAMELCEDKEGLVYANLANSLGQMECERSHIEEAHKYMDKSLQIRKKLLPKDHVEIANGLNNYANIVFQELKPGACEEALKLYDECIAISMQDDVHRKKFLHIPHTNISRVLRVLKRYDESIEHANKSRSYAIAQMGAMTHFDGLADYQIGNALFDKGEYDEAEHFWKRALKIFSTENETHPTTTAARIKLSCIDMKRNKFAEAIAKLQMVLLVARLNEESKGDKGETARVTRKLAEAYELHGEIEKAKELKESAELMRRKIQKDRFQELPDEDLSYAMMNFHAF